jgi:hypothetical protein
MKVKSIGSISGDLRSLFISSEMLSLFGGVGDISELIFWFHPIKTPR